MKTLPRVIGLAVLALTVTIPVTTLTGCAILSGENQTQLQRVITGTKVASYVATTEYLRANPTKADRFAQVAQSLWVLETSETLDAATLLAVVNQLPIKELKSDRAQMIVTAATLVLSDYAGSIPVDQLANLKPIAKAMREGIELALPKPASKP